MDICFHVVENDSWPLPHPAYLQMSCTSGLEGTVSLLRDKRSSSQGHSLRFFVVRTMACFCQIFLHFRMLQEFQGLISDQFELREQLAEIHERIGLLSGEKRNGMVL